MMGKEEKDITPEQFRNFLRKNFRTYVKIYTKFLIRNKQSKKILVLETFVKRKQEPQQSNKEGLTPGTVKAPSGSRTVPRTASSVPSPVKDPSGKSVPSVPSGPSPVKYPSGKSVSSGQRGTIGTGVSSSSKGPRTVPSTASSGSKVSSGQIRPPDASKTASTTKQATGQPPSTSRNNKNRNSKAGNGKSQPTQPSTTVLGNIGTGNKNVSVTIEKDKNDKMELK